MEQIRGLRGRASKIAGERYDDAHRRASALVAEQAGRSPIHAYDQWETLQGQATVGPRVRGAGAGLDALLVAVGGGGLIGGIAAWFQGASR
jgi:threonine dehydratase